MRILLGLLFLCSSAWGQTYNLKKSNLTYVVTHLLKTTEGTSTQAKGKGVCDKGQCDFLIAVPVKSFDSGNSNRDLHMLEEMKGAAHPMIVARISVKQTDLAKGDFPGSVELEAAGVKKTVAVKSIKVSALGTGLRIEAVLPFTLSQFNVERPSLLTVAVEDLVPVKVSSEWSQE